MLILSRALGQAFLVNDDFVFTLATIRNLEGTLLRTRPNGSEEVEVAIRSGGYQEIAPQVVATFIRHRPGWARVGFIATAGLRIRSIESSQLLSFKEPA